MKLYELKALFEVNVMVVVVTVGAVMTVYSALPPRVKSVVDDTAKDLVSGLAGSFIKRLWWRFFPSPETKARQVALSAAIAHVLVDQPEAKAIGLAKALGEPPFAQVILAAVERPTLPVDANAVRGAFAESMYELSHLHIDEQQLIRELQAAFLEALRVSDTPTGRELHLGTMAERTHHVVGGIAATVDAISATKQVADQQQPLEALMQQAKSLI